MIYTFSRPEIGCESVLSAGPWKVIGEHTPNNVFAIYYRLWFALV